MFRGHIRAQSQILKISRGSGARRGPARVKGWSPCGGKQGGKAPRRKKILVISHPLRCIFLDLNDIKCSLRKVLKMFQVLIEIGNEFSEMKKIIRRKI